MDVIGTQCGVIAVVLAVAVSLAVAAAVL
jgi:hypothetical protein